MVEHASFFPFKNCSLIIGSSETCRFWLVGDIGFLGLLFLVKAPRIMGTIS